MIRALLSFPEPVDVHSLSLVDVMAAASRMHFVAPNFFYDQEVVPCAGDNMNHPF